jgi:hypothetical protein
MHSWTKERPASRITPQVALIIPCEMQIGETKKHTSNLQQNSKKKNIRLEMWTHVINLDERINNLNFNKELHWIHQI